MSCCCCSRVSWPEPIKCCAAMVFWAKVGVCVMELGGLACPILDVGVAWFMIGVAFCMLGVPFICGVPLRLIGC